MFDFSSEDSFYDLDNDSNNQTKNDHCSNGKVKSKVFSFDPDITRQSADPVQFIVKEID